MGEAFRGGKREDFTTLSLSRSRSSLLWNGRKELKPLDRDLLLG